MLNYFIHREYRIVMKFEFVRPNMFEYLFTDGKEKFFQAVIDNIVSNKDYLNIDSNIFEIRFSNKDTEQNSKIIFTFDLNLGMTNLELKDFVMEKATSKYFHTERFQELFNELTHKITNLNLN